MEIFAIAFDFVGKAFLFAGSLIISCAIGFSVFSASKRVLQLGASAIVLIILHLVSFKLISAEAPFGYSALVLLACVVLTLRLWDATDSMLFNVIRAGLFLFIALLVIFHLVFMFFSFTMWLSVR